MFKLLIYLIINTSLYTKIITPTFAITSKGFVNDFVIDNNKIYVANDEGSVEVFNLHTKELVDEIFYWQLN